MAYIKIDNNIVVNKRPNYQDGYMQVDDSIICGMIQNPDGTFSVPQPSLAEAKRKKCTEIDAERDRRQSLPLEYTFPDGQIGHIQRRNQKDERNIQAVDAAAKTLVLEENTTDTVHFTDQENVKHLLTGPEGMAFGIFVFNDYARLQSAARTHKDNVNALAKVEDVQNYDYSGDWE